MLDSNVNELSGDLKPANIAGHLEQRDETLGDAAVIAQYPIVSTGAAIA